MCGRFSTNANLDALLALLGVDGAGVPLAEIIGARANIAPSESIAVIANRAVDADHPRQVELFSWGLVPFSTKDAAHGRRPFNAPTETAPAATSPAETTKQLGLFGVESFTSRKGSRYSRP